MDAGDGGRHRAAGDVGGGGERPRLLDLFCGGGGAGKGYHDAGFDVVGVDVEPQPRYPFEFVQDNALAVLTLFEVIDSCFGPFDAIHASPPCQHDSSAGRRYPETQAKHPDLIGPTKALLGEVGLPYVLENVGGARWKLDHPAVICGRAVGVGVRRHRLFECNFPLLSTQCQCRGDELPVYGKLDGRRVWTRKDGSELRAPRTLGQAASAMGIDWLEWDELREAIPPAYTEHIGHYLMAEVRVRSMASTARPSATETLGGVSRPHQPKQEEER